MQNSFASVSCFVWYRIIFTHTFSGILTLNPYYNFICHISMNGFTLRRISILKPQAVGGIENDFKNTNILLFRGAVCTRLFLSVHSLKMKPDCDGSGLTMPPGSSVGWRTKVEEVFDRSTREAPRRHQPQFHRISRSAQECTVCLILLSFLTMSK